MECTCYSAYALDREWYFTAEESRILLMNNMEEILNRFETDEKYKYYILDGQTAILEDYFAVKPKNKERIKSLVQKGKLIIGPWYTQTDEMMVAGESIVRNLLYGIKDSEEFGQWMKIGYLPDSFGQTSQLPQLLNGFGITNTVFWRGCSERHGTNKTEFIWKSKDGSEVLSQILPLGYAIGKYLPANEKELKDRLDTYFKVLQNGATGNNIILPNGHDQMPIQQNIFDIIDILKGAYPDKDFFISKYENIFDDLEANRANLDIIEGEFNDPKYMRVHRTISSTRMDIKIINAEIENKLTNILEPLASIAYSLGFEYHHGLIELIWKEIMKNHAHDSISCCCSDEVHREIMSRFEIANDKTDKLINFYMRKIADAIEDKQGMDKLVTFNLLSYKRDEVVKSTIRLRANNFTLLDSENNEIPFDVISKKEIDPGLIDRQIVHYGNYDPFYEFDIKYIAKDIPSVGYKTFYIKDTDNYKEVKNVTTKNYIENDFYKVIVNENGTINIYSKKLNKEYNNLLLLEDGSDDGDEYDYSPLEDDFIINNKNISANVVYNHTNYSEEATINYDVDIPKDLDSRKQKQIDSTMNVKVKVILDKYSDKINIESEIDNNSKEHRVRFIIPTTYESQESIADIQFGSIKRPVIDTANEVWEKEKWKEKPVPVYQMMSYADLTDNHSGLSVITNGLREYEIVGNKYDSIALTLFRCVGLLGKEEMFYRPGRPSGIKLETPDSQMIGKWNFNFSIFIHKDDTIKGLVPQKAKEYLTPIYTYNKTPYNAMKLNPVRFNVPDNYSLLNKDITGSILSVIKKAEKDDELIVRFFNPSESKCIEDSININTSNTKLYETNLNEKKIKELENNNISFKPNQIKTISFTKK